MTKTETTQDTDAFGVWRQLYDANERPGPRRSSRRWNLRVRRSSGRLLETVAAQKSVRDNMRAYLETMNVPTREDIARLGELVIGLEEKSDRIADRLDGSTTYFARNRLGRQDRRHRPSAPARPPRSPRSTRCQAARHVDRALRRGYPGRQDRQVAKRLDTIDRAVRSRAVEAGKPVRPAPRAARGDWLAARSGPLPPPDRRETRQRCRCSLRRPGRPPRSPPLTSRPRRDGCRRMSPTAAPRVPDAALACGPRPIARSRWHASSWVHADAPVGQTPKELIWRKNKARLYRYVRSKPATHRATSSSSCRSSTAPTSWTCGRGGASSSTSSARVMRSS